MILCVINDDDMQKWSLCVTDDDVDMQKWSVCVTGCDSDMQKWSLCVTSGDDDMQKWSLCVTNDVHGNDHVDVEGCDADVNVMTTTPTETEMMMVKQTFNWPSPSAAILINGISTDQSLNVLCSWCRDPAPSAASHYMSFVLGAEIQLHQRPVT